MPQSLPFLQWLLVSFFKVVNAVIPWHKFPKYVGAINLLALRYELRAKNLYDTYPDASYQGSPDKEPITDSGYLVERNSDGKFNDLKEPLMGCAGMRFGRNVPRSFTKAPTEDELLHPSPRLISERLLQRPPGTFKPATIVNLLAAAWIQFQVHDWLNHETDTKQVEVPLTKNDKWTEEHMILYRTKKDEALDQTDKVCPAFKNQNTPWWDASQIYGSSEVRTRELRSKTDDGKLAVSKINGAEFLPRDANGIPQTGFFNNWWLGLELLHTLFALEHNAIADMLHTHNPDWNSDKLFSTARLINCALMAKIHTVEWTPAILSHPTLQVAMDANWWGLAGEKINKMLGRISKSEAISGIPGSGVDHDNVPYSLTEEFTSVYRLHPLIPDTVSFSDVKTGAPISTLSMQQISFEHATDALQGIEGQPGKVSFASAFYTFGISNPGAITIKNHPTFLRDLHLPDGQHIDMGTIDILRDRERAVPRYNAFRRLFHKPPVKSFLELAGGDNQLAAEISEIYDGDLEKVDNLVGLLCEPVPKGFGFSDTAFRVFILMASRRLKSDRFIAGEWGKDSVYTREGTEWVQNSGMADVLVRHFPEVAGSLKDVRNPFAPWGKVGKA